RLRVLRLDVADLRQSLPDRRERDLGQCVAAQVGPAVRLRVLVGEELEDSLAGHDRLGGLGGPREDVVALRRGTDRVDHALALERAGAAERRGRIPGEALVVARAADRLLYAGRLKHPTLKLIPDLGVRLSVRLERVGPLPGRRR